MRKVYQDSLSGLFIRPSLCVSIILFPHPVFIKTRRLYQSNHILLQLCLCITLKKGYTPNQEYSTIPILGVQHQTSNPFYLSQYCLRTFFQIYHCLPFLIYYCIVIIWMLAGFYNFTSE